MNAIFVGTLDGILRLERDNGGWAARAHGLRGTEVTGISIRPDRRDTAYVATRNDGLYRTTDGGQRWERIGETVLRERIRALAMAPSDPATLYVGTEPAALFVSPDEGKTWTETPGVRELAQTRAWTYPVPTVAPHIRGIAVDPKDPRRVFLAGQVGGVLWTEDGGKRWMDVRDPIDMDVHAITVDSREPSTVYAATGGGEAFPAKSAPPKGRPLYRSRDGGRSWESITDTLERTYAVPVKVDPRNSQVLYLGVAFDEPPHWLNRPEKADSALMKSTDGGRTWRRLTGGLPERMLSMVESIEFDPEDPSTVLMATGGEGARYIKLTEGELFMSRDGGERWERIGGALPLVTALAVQ